MKKLATILFFPLVTLLYIMYKWAEIPAKVPMRWNLKGEISIYAPKQGLFVLLVIPIIVALVFFFLPRLNLFKKNQELFRNTVQKFSLIINIFFCFLAVLILKSSTGTDINMPKIITISALVLVIFIGNYFGKLKPNYLFGIRTPWTLKDNIVWAKTHNFAGKLWVFGGVATIILQMIFGEIWMFLVVVGLITIIPMVYSYYIYKNKIKQE